MTPRVSRAVDAVTLEGVEAWHEQDPTAGADCLCGCTAGQHENQYAGAPCIGCESCGGYCPQEA